MGRLTQRCAGQWCGHRVYGATSFRVLRAEHGGRSPICRFCEGRDRANARFSMVRGLRQRTIAKLRAEEQQLASKLTKARTKRRRLEQQARLTSGLASEQVA